jgi:hypothetical protein
LASNREFAALALARLADEAPRHYSEIARRISTTPSRFVIDDEILLATSDGREMHVESASQDRPVALQASLGASDVVRLIDGTAMLETLLAEDRLIVKGDSEALLRIAEATSIFLDGAARLRSFSQLFERYREWVHD